MICKFIIINVNHIFTFAFYIWLIYAKIKNILPFSRNEFQSG